VPIGVPDGPEVFRKTGRTARSIPGLKAMPDKPRRNWFRWLAALALAAGFLALALVLLPCLDRFHSRPLANESAAVNQLRSIARLENDFAEAHATRGYTCELAELGPKQYERTTGAYDPSDPFRTGIKSGYKFAVFNCRTDGKTVVAHYQAATVPTEQGKTGLRAFCTDESGVIWYDKEGSASGCLASRRQLLESPGSLETENSLESNSQIRNPSTPSPRNHRHRH